MLLLVCVCVMLMGVIESLDELHGIVRGCVIDSAPPKFERASDLRDTFTR